MGKLIIDGNSVYEVDEECLKNRKVPDYCKVGNAERQSEKTKQQTLNNKRGGAG